MSQAGPRYSRAISPGERFGRLVAIGPSHRGHRRHWYWRFHCDCGAEHVADVDHVKRGRAQSCGCLRNDRAAEASRNRGRGLNMRARCYNPKNTSYPNYGARGITVCAEWRGSFDAFLAHVGARPSPAHSIDRIDNDRGYEPGNVRWATDSEQARNRRVERPVTYRGQELSLRAACDIAGVKLETAKVRLARGWSIERALTNENFRNRRGRPRDREADARSASL